MRQKDVFWESEADAWYERNHSACLQQRFGGDEPVSGAIVKIAASPEYAGKKLRILEVGCGEGGRLSWLAENLGAEVFGIEPSAKAVEQARACGVNAQRGTADMLPYEDASFDILVFGFCLYLCDQQDLFAIAREADRVLKSNAWVVIHDFFSPIPMRREYHHKPGVYSHKMDYRSLFAWHPSYTCYSHVLAQHGQPVFTDDPQEWVATSVMRKKALNGP